MNPKNHSQVWSSSMTSGLETEWAYCGSR